MVRLSGPAVRATLAALAPALTPEPRKAHLVTLVDPADRTALDTALALYFPAPHSFTGDEVCELHVHGSPAVLERLFAVLRRLGLRLAHPGEFTRRAFANGKLDLTQAEGLADLVAADSESQRIQALAQMGGAWAKQVAGWQDALLDALAWLESSIDFADEADVPDDVAVQARAPIARVEAEISAVLAQSGGEIVRDGLWVAIIGPPNVGKSTLLNVLAGRDAAIVSDLPGTTRDIVEVRLDLDGYVVVLADTAGLRDQGDAIEREGMRRARDRAGTADLRILVQDASDPSPRVGLETDNLLRPGDLIFHNKAELAVQIPSAQESDNIAVLSGSALTGDLGGLIEALRNAVRRRADAGGSVLITRTRHREVLVAARSALARAQIAPLDLAAEDVRAALAALSRILGRFDVEQVLDRIFSSFCIGK